MQAQVNPEPLVNNTSIPTVTVPPGNTITAPANSANTTTQPMVNIQNIPGVGAIDVESLKKLVAHLDGGKAVLPTQALSPFSTEVINAPLPMNYKNTTSDLRFHETFDAMEFLGRFNIEMGVYQISNMVICRLLAVTFHDSAYQ